MSDETDVLKSLSQFIDDEAIPSLADIEVEILGGRSQAIAALYITILELAECIAFICDKKYALFGNILLRSQLEALSDLVLLSSRSSHFDNLLCEVVESQTKKLIASKSGNPYLSESSEAYDVDEQLREWAAKKRFLKRKGARILSPGQKMTKAGFDLEYTALYGHLSAHVHNGLVALDSRHFMRGPEGAVGLGMFRPVAIEAIEPVVHSTLNAAQNASCIFHEHFDTKHSDKFRRLWDGQLSTINS